MVEIARSSRYYDLNEKKADYERAGVREYVVVELDPDRIHWFVRRGDHFEDLPPGPDGIYRSEVFPALARSRGTLCRRPGSADRSPGAGPGDARARGLRGQAGRGPRAARHAKYGAVSRSIELDTGMPVGQVDRSPAGAVSAARFCLPSFAQRRRARALSVASSTAYEMRKWLSRSEKTLPGMISRLFLIASATNSLPVPHGARGKA